MSAGETWILLDGLAEKFRRGSAVLAVEAIDVLQAEVICRPGIEVVSHGQACTGRLMKRNLDLER